MFLRWHSTHRKRERNRWGEERVLPSPPRVKQAGEIETPRLTRITLLSPSQPPTTLETRASTHGPTGLQTPSRTALELSVFIVWFCWGITAWGSQALPTFLLEYKRRMPTNTLEVYNRKYIMVFVDDYISNQLSWVGSVQFLQFINWMLLFYHKYSFDTLL